jgi:peptidoglycan/xylan/chitin deacetylase (PgdA/CDA1 family)
MQNLPIRVIKTVGKKVLYSAAIMQAVRTYTRRGLRILVYHRFPENRSGLIAQCRHIRRFYQPISMHQVAEKFVSGTRLPDRALAITVDDGYHDFWLNAHPVFSMYEIPVTVFVVTDFVDGRRWPWWDEVKYMFAHTSRASLQFAGGQVDIQGDRKSAAHKVTEGLKQMPHAEFLSQLATLEQWLDVQVPEHAPAEYAPLSWESVRKLAGAGVEFGVHTRTHPILSKLTDVTRLCEEIAGSKRRLEEELTIPSLHFSYPNGTYDDYDARTLAVVQKCGFATAVTAECGFNYTGADPFQLLRVGVEPSMPEQIFAQLLAGVRSHPRRRQHKSS